jgi:hypothetical protein
VQSLPAGIFSAPIVKLTVNPVVMLDDFPVIEVSHKEN